MTQNKQIDLNNILFEQLERLNDGEYMEENSEMEFAKAQAISNIGKTIIANARLALDVTKHKQEYGLENSDIPRMISNE